MHGSPLARTPKVDWVFCEVPGEAKATGPLYFWSYIFYVSKYYEMVAGSLGWLRRGGRRAVCAVLWNALR